MNSEQLSFFDGCITINADLCNGKPTIRGQRITVQTILEFLRAGESNEDIQTCLVFATQLMGQKYSLQKIA